MIFYLIFCVGVCVFWRHVLRLLASYSASFGVIFCVFWRHILRLLASYSASFGVIFCVCVFFWEIASLRNLKWTLRPRLLASNSSLYTTHILNLVAVSIFLDVSLGKKFKDLASWVFWRFLWVSDLLFWHLVVQFTLVLNIFNMKTQSYQIVSFCWSDEVLHLKTTGALALIFAGRKLPLSHYLKRKWFARLDRGLCSRKDPLFETNRPSQLRTAHMLAETFQCSPSAWRQSWT